MEKGNAYRVWMANLKERNCLEDVAAKQEDNTCIKIDLNGIAWFELMWLRIATIGSVS
jgi:hypothetical protein